MITISDVLGAKKIMKKIATKSLSVKFDKDNENCSPETYLYRIESYLGNRVIKPKSKTDHVGIEIEFIGSNDLFVDLMMTFLEKGLDKNVVLGYDGSIDCNDDTERGYEIKIIDSEKNILKTLKRVMNILSWYDIYVNESCGLHIHLDGRNRNKMDMYDKLFNMRYVLYKMVPAYREYGDYCEMPDEQCYAIGAHNQGIEISKHDTVEVRLHNGTLNFNLIANWIRLLLKIVSTDFSKNNKEWVKVPKFVGPRLAKYAKSQMKLMRSA